MNMDAKATSGERSVPFKSPKQFLSNLDPSIAANVVASAADVALIIDDGVIKDIAIGNGELTKERYDQVWRGKKWIETVTVESRPKIEDLLRTKPSSKVHWRQVNHPSPDGLDIPIKYTAVRAGNDNRIVALGRDLRAVSVLQQRLVEAHQGLERDYDRLREAEARYRLLFESVSEAVLVVNGDSYIIEEANPAAKSVLARSERALVDLPLPELFLKKAQRAVDVCAADALARGSSVSETLKLKGGGACRLSLTPFRYGDSVRLIARILHDDAHDARVGSDGVLSILEDLPDGLVVADDDLQILHANTAFAEMARFSSAQPLAGRRVDEFLGRSATDMNVLLSSIKNNGSVRNFSTVMVDRFGAEERVEVSAVEAASDGGEVYGFSIRNVARRLEAGPRIGEQLPQSVDQLTSLVGKVSLKEIVRESTDLIEKLCIEAALEITDDNRASAAEILGLSRQGLYSKLKRFGFGD